MEPNEPTHAVNRSWEKTRYWMHDGTTSHNNFTPITNATPEMAQKRTPKNFLVWGEGSFIFLPPIVTDETRAGERGVSPFEIREMLSGDGAYDLGHIPRVVLWRSGSALSWEVVTGKRQRKGADPSKAANTPPNLPAADLLLNPEQK